VVAIKGDEVCGFDHITYSSADAAHGNNTGVMHCEACGQCSNYHDISIYNNVTKDTLTTTTTRCAIITLIMGETLGRWCMNQLVGFTSSCLDCWIENILCDKHKCLWACITGEYKNVTAGDIGLNEDLSPCLLCDELECGPAFKKCAGANRRRCGIVIDNDRNSSEICTEIDPWPMSSF